MLGREHDEGHMHGLTSHKRVDYVVRARGIMFGDQTSDDSPASGDPAELAAFLRQHEGDICRHTDCEGCVNEWDSIALLAVRSDVPEMFQAVLDYKHFLSNWKVLGGIVAFRGVADMIQLFLAACGDKVDIDDMMACAKHSNNKDALPRLMCLLQ